MKKCVVNLPHKTQKFIHFKKKTQSFLDFEHTTSAIKNLQYVYCHLKRKLSKNKIYKIRKPCKPYKISFFHKKNRNCLGWERGFGGLSGFSRIF